MKKLLNWTLIALFATGVTSCKKKDDLTVGFSEEIQKIVPQTILDEVKANGMNINEGRIPPTLNGTFLINPFELLSPYSEKDGYKKGQIINAYHYKFHSQSADKKSIFLDYTNNGSDKGTGLGAFVAGNGNKFTIFAETKGRSSSVDYVMLNIFSGEITPEGIKDFQMSLYMKEKSEAPGDGALIPLNTGRIWFDNDFISGPSTANLRLPASENTELKLSAAGLK